jgi:hypothetical protein
MFQRVGRIELKRVITIILMNSLDAILTSILLINKQIIELNPFMLYIIDGYDIVCFLVFKLVLINLMIMLLYKNIKNKISFYGLNLIFVVYSVIMIMHLFCLINIFLNF